jgi:hypothetical protein
MAECKPEVTALVAALEDCGVTVIVIKEAPGGDLLQAVSNGMDQADLFVIMGTRTYGRVTSGVIDTYKEMQLIQSSKKPYFLINMNPEDSLMEFEEPATNLVFNLTTVAWERWEVSRPDMKPLDPKTTKRIVGKLRAAGVAAGAAAGAATGAAAAAAAAAAGAGGGAAAGAGEAGAGGGEAGAGGAAVV